MNPSLISSTLIQPPTQTPTPMMAQWEQCKKEAGNALLFFRLGDFYEAFGQDAAIISKEVNLTLTMRNGVPMCGVPFHTAENYIDRLLAKRYKVAIAEQMEDAGGSKGLVRREIVRIVTPGTTLSTALLSEKRNNFFASIVQVGKTIGLAFLDVTTGEFSSSEFEDANPVFDALHRMRPAEILADKAFLISFPDFFTPLSHVFPFLLNKKGECDPQIAHATLTFHLDCSKIAGKKAAVSAAGMLLLHLKEELNLTLEQVQTIDLQPFSHTMGLDHSTFQHLELAGSFLEFLDQTITPMGGRLLASWLKAPLLDCNEIGKRQEAIALFLSDWGKAKALHEPLSQIKDLERLMMKVVTQIAGPRDLFALGLSLQGLPALKEQLTPFSFPPFFDAAPIASSILSTLQPQPPLRIGEGEIFQDGFDQELDHLRQIAKDSMSWMAQYQNQLRIETGIKTLKVGYTRAFGYYIEVSRGQSERVPSTFQRRQTLTQAERFVTEELKQFEHQVLTAEERSKAMESDFFLKLRAKIGQYAPQIYEAAKIVARIDLLLNFAHIAKYENWCRPVIDESPLLEIRGGRHPIVERAVGKATFIANDTRLSPERQMMLITGPNMAGKSTYMRQTALIVILAQIGSYVPALSAHIGIVDQLFSRIGATDDLARGQSTFMVEMSETAHILRYATSRSLIILDEIGRGTSTYDGISIAWSVADFLLTQPGKQAKTLFATHYWELTTLQERYPHLINYHTAIQETGDGILFLRKMARGGTDKSYGIHVAKLAGLPTKVLRKATEMLEQLEQGTAWRKEETTKQLSLFHVEHEEKYTSRDSRIGIWDSVKAAQNRSERFDAAQMSSLESREVYPWIETLKTMDLNQITPLKALELLIDWQKTLW